MRKFVLAAGPLLALALAMPAFSQGASQSPPSPNAGNNEPQSGNSLPPGARTMPRGTTGVGQMGAVTTTGVPVRYRRHRRHYHRPTNPDSEEGRTVPVPQSQ